MLEFKYRFKKAFKKSLLYVISVVTRETVKIFWGTLFAALTVVSNNLFPVTPSIYNIRKTFDLI